MVELKKMKNFLWYVIAGLAVGALIGVECQLGTITTLLRQILAK